MNVTEVLTEQYGWAGLNCLSPAVLTSGRCAYPDPIVIAIGAQGISSTSLIAWAKSNFQALPAQPPTAGIPHYNVAGNGAVYQFVSESDSPWAIDNQSFSPTATVVINEGINNPNTYGIFITFESGETNDVDSVPYPNGVQLKAIADLVRDIRSRTMGIPLVTYRQIHRSYAGSDQSDTRLLNAVALLVSQPLPPLCNADICFREAPPNNALLMTYDPTTRCATGLVPVESVSGETGFNVTDGDSTYPIPTNGAGILSFVDTTSINFASSSTVNGAEIRATAIINPILSNRISITPQGLYVAPDTGSDLDWCVVPAPAPATFNYDAQTVLVYDSDTGCIRRVDATGMIAESLDWCLLPVPQSATFSAMNHRILVRDSSDNCIKSISPTQLFALGSFNLFDTGIGSQNVSITAPNNNITFVGGNGIGITVDPIRTVNVGVRIGINPLNILTTDEGGNLVAIPEPFDWCGLPLPATGSTAEEFTFLVRDTTSGCIERIVPADIAQLFAVNNQFIITDGLSEETVIASAVYPEFNVVRFGSNNPITTLVSPDRMVTYGLRISADSGNLLSLGSDDGLYATLDWCNPPSLFNIVDPVVLSSQQFLSYDNETNCIVASSGIALQDAILGGSAFMVTDGGTDFQVEASTYADAPLRRVTFLAGDGLAVAIDPLNRTVTYSLSEAIESELAGIEQEQAQMRNAMEGKENTQPLRSEFDALAAVVDDLVEHGASSSSVASVSARVTVLEALPARVTALETLPSRVTALEALPARVTALEAIPARVTALEVLPARVTALEALPARITALEALPARVTTLETQLAATEAARASLQATVNTQATTISQMLADIATLQAAMNNKADKSGVYLKSETYSAVEIDRRFGIGAGGKFVLFDNTKAGLTAPTTAGGVRVAVLGLINADVQFMIQASYDTLRKMNAIT